MPEDSFSAQNRITTTEISQGRFLKSATLRKYIARDVELMDRMAKGGPPTVVTAASSILPYDPGNAGLQPDGTYVPVDVVISQNTTVTLGGILYCKSLTVEPGAVVNVNKFLSIVATGDVTVHGHINADGIGVQPPANESDIPDRGISAGGGGGGGDSSPGINGSPGLNVAGGLGGVGQDANGSNAPAMPAIDQSIALMQRNIYMLVGGGAGGNGGGSTGPYPRKRGGAGGGYIEIQCRTLIISSNGLISARGMPGVDEWDVHWAASGGGGGGIIHVRCAAYAGGDRLSARGGDGGLGRVAGATSGGRGGDGIMQIEVYK